MSEHRYLLLQARHVDDPMRDQERNAFANKLQTTDDQVTCWDLLKGPPAVSFVTEFDFLLMGGSGEFLVSQGDLPQFSALLMLLREVSERSFPTFASCFGFQCMVEALGGEIVYDPGRTEVGTYPLTLTEAGKTDPVLGALPPSFMAQMGRKDRAVRLPEGAVHLASSEKCPFQAFRLADKPIWATQFHPELTGIENRERFMKYMTSYESHVDEDSREEMLARFVDSPETEGMLLHFARLALL